jgi:UDP-galactopyranose mutase
VVRIDPWQRKAVTLSGKVFDWEFLVSTMPLPELLRIVEGVPAGLVELADRLEFMSLRVELLRTKGRLETPIQRVYCADPAMPPHKIALNHNSSAFLREQPCHAIMAEVSVSPEKVVEVETIAPKTIALLCDLKILRSPGDIAWTSHVDVHYAYPVYTAERPGLVAEIKDWLRRHHIFTAGRFGDWEYVNSDKCVAKGLGLGRELRESYEPVAVTRAL